MLLECLWRCFKYVLLHKCFDFFLLLEINVSHTIFYELTFSKCPEAFNRIQLILVRCSEYQYLIICLCFGSDDKRVMNPQVVKENISLLAPHPRLKISKEINEITCAN